jgi:hypothetical protein
MIPAVTSTSGLAARQEITSPARLWSRAEVVASPCPVPDVAGIYGWYFRELPFPMDVSGCITHNELALLYVGISPKSPPTNGKPPSSQTLRKRVRYHYSGNAEGSTLRLTLGCLLADRLGIDLRRVGSGKRRTFLHNGEAALSEWMAENAFVTWIDTPEPWIAEHRLIQEVDLPLNLDQNSGNPFHRTLSEIRKQAKLRAAQLPICGG